jgi:chorismate mutase
MIAEGKKKDLSEQFILRVYKAIHQESINHQQSIFKQ